MNYSIRLNDPEGPHTDENGTKFRFVDPVWRNSGQRRGYDLYVDNKRLAWCVPQDYGRSRIGWNILPNPYAAWPLPIANDGNPYNDEIFRRINEWVGPFANRRGAMEYALWTLGYTDRT